MNRRGPLYSLNDSQRHYVRGYLLCSCVTGLAWTHPLCEDHRVYICQWTGRREPGEVPRLHGFRPSGVWDTALL